MKPLHALKTITLICVSAAATSLLIQACGGGATAQTVSDADAIEGVWDSTVTIKDCATGATLNTFKGSSLFHRGGSLSGDNSNPPPTRGAAFGAWNRGTGGAYTANLWFTRFNPDGTLAGTQKVERSFVVAANGDTFSGTLTLQIINPTGAVVAQGCGSESAARVTW